MFVTKEKAVRCIHEVFETAISGAVYAAKEAEGTTLLILQNHLKQLCDLQLSTLKVDVLNHQQLEPEA